ncbi:MAG: hypothetical protein IMZ53_13075 [Thermoplasmata archaeon]|nr:hypothetical protein [Thermoplasmata archaeon]
MAAPLTKKPTSAESRERVQYVKEMIIEPYTRSEIIRYCSKEWGIGSRAVDQLMAKATAEIEIEYAPKRKAAIEQHIARREKLLRRCKKEDSWLYLKANDSLAKLQGLLNEPPQATTQLNIIIGGKKIDRSRDSNTTT